MRKLRKMPFNKYFKIKKKKTITRKAGGIFFRMFYSKKTNVFNSEILFRMINLLLFFFLTKFFKVVRLKIKKKNRRKKFIRKFRWRWRLFLFRRRFLKHVLMFLNTNLRRFFFIK